MLLLWLYMIVLFAFRSTVEYGNCQNLRQWKFKNWENYIKLFCMIIGRIFQALFNNSTVVVISIKFHTFSLSLFLSAWDARLYKTPFPITILNIKICLICGSNRVYGLEFGHWPTAFVRATTSILIIMDKSFITFHLRQCVF